MLKRFIFILLFLLSSASANELFAPFEDFNSLTQTTLDKVNDLKTQETRSLSFVKIMLSDINQDQLILSFADKNYLVFKSKISQSFGKRIWEGTIEGDQWSYINLVQDQDLLMGTMSAENRRYELRYMGEGIMAVVEAVRTLKQDDAATIPEGLAGAIQTQALGTDDGDTVDVMVLYTANTRATSGSTVQIQSEIVSAIAYANAALARSCATFRYRLQHMEEIVYAEQGIVIDLNNLTDATGVDANHTIRDAKGADLVQLWTNYITPGICGLAWVLPKELASATHGFSVVVNPNTVGCGLLPSAHEFGHNMGLSHDRYQQQVSMDDYSYYRGFGFVDKQHNVGSIMSYQGECYEVSGQYCEYVPYFSNPNIIRDGTIFGKAGIADGIGYMNENSLNIARFRNEVNASNPDLTGCSETGPEGLTSCFVATAAYGSFLDEHVKALREFRDSVLLQYGWGRTFVAWYYKNSPEYADIIAKNDTLRVIARVLLTPLVYSIMYPWLLPLLLLLAWQLRSFRKRSFA